MGNRTFVPRRPRIRRFVGISRSLWRRGHVNDDNGTGSDADDETTWRRENTADRSEFFRWMENWVNMRSET